MGSVYVQSSNSSGFSLLDFAPSCGLSPVTGVSMLSVFLLTQTTGDYKASQPSRVEKPNFVAVFSSMKGDPGNTLSKILHYFVFIWNVVNLFAWIIDISTNCLWILRSPFLKVKLGIYRHSANCSENCFSLYIIIGGFHLFNIFIFISFRIVKVTFCKVIVYHLVFPPYYLLGEAKENCEILI